MPGNVKIRRWHRAATGSLMLLVHLGCTSVVDAPFDVRAEPLTPPPVYARWWAMTESCSGLTGRLESISWYSTPGSDFVVSQGRQVGGYWAPVSNSILLAGNSVLEGEVVRHEMLHALIRAADGHSRQYFLEKCGGVVSCREACVEDAGPPTPIDDSVPRISSSQLEISVSIVPAAPSSMIDGGAFLVLVTATHRGPTSVVVNLNPAGAGDGFSYSIFGPSGGTARGERALDPALMRFAPGETKRKYFDFFISTSFQNGGVVPGIYTVQGGYDRRNAFRQNVVIGP
jgi:hypothetical protein